MNGPNRTKISYTLLRLARKLLEIEKRTSYYGTNKPLFEAEIHMIKSIKENQDLHVTGLAEKLGVTKGAVSQLLMKLEKKGMILKERDSSNQSRLLLGLTPMGRKAFQNHERLHREFDELVNGSLTGASKENLDFLKGFLLSVETVIDEFKVPCYR